MDAAHSLADRIARQDPLAVRITKSVFHAPAEAHPLIDQLAQGILFESQAKFDRMQAFLDKKAAKKTAKNATTEVRTGRSNHEQFRTPGDLPATVGVLGGGRMGAGIAHAFLINGANVLVVERDEDSAEAARERVESAAAKSIERGATDGNLDEMVSRLVRHRGLRRLHGPPAGGGGRPGGLGPEGHVAARDRGAAGRGCLPGLQHVLAVRQRPGPRAEAARRTSWACTSSTRSRRPR